LTCSFNSSDRDIGSRSHHNSPNRPGSLNTGNSQNLICDNEDRTKLAVCFDARNRDNGLGCNNNVANESCGFNPSDRSICIGSDGDIANKTGSLDPRDFNDEDDLDGDIAQFGSGGNPVREYVGRGYNKDITKLTGGFYPSYGYVDIATTKIGKGCGGKWGKTEHWLCPANLYP
jgi:hypothetical protein